jgi:hypothetical protein
MRVAPDGRMHTRPVVGGPSISGEEDVTEIEEIGPEPFVVAFWQHMGLAEDAMRAGIRAVDKIQYYADADTHQAAELRDDLGKKAMGCWAQATAHATMAQAYASTIGVLAVPVNVVELTRDTRS